MGHRGYMQKTSYKWENSQTGKWEESVNLISHIEEYIPAFSSLQWSILATL